VSVWIESHQSLRDHPKKDQQLEECLELGIPVVKTLTELRDMRGSEP